MEIIIILLLLLMAALVHSVYHHGWNFFLGWINNWENARFIFIVLIILTAILVMPWLHNRFGLPTGGIWESLGSAVGCFSHI
jgi:hypothetical protein